MTLVSSGLVLSALIAILYGVLYLPHPTSTMRSIMKTAPIALLAIIAWLAGGSPFLVAALGLSAVGDFALSRTGRHWFLIGLSGFLLAHCAYVVVFVDLGADWVVLTGAVWRLGAAFGLLIAMVVIWRWLIVSIGPDSPSGDLRIPVTAYVGVIAVMGLVALALPAEYALMTTGAMFFILSDAILAAELFKLDGAVARRWRADYLVWLFYCSGQLALAAGGLL